VAGTDVFLSVPPEGVLLSRLSAAHQHGSLPVSFAHLQGRERTAPKNELGCDGLPSVLQHRPIVTLLCVTSDAQPFKS
jgi:hypothetical protein